MSLHHHLATAALALATALAGSACGDDGGGPGSVAGSYQITLYTEAAGGCDTAPSPVSGMTHLLVKTGSFFGLTTVEAYVCASAQGCGVGDDAFPEFTFLEPKGGGWVTDASASSFGGASCSLSLSKQSLFKTETGVHIERTFAHGTFTLSEPECTPDAAKARAAELACDEKVILDATAL